MEDHAYFSQRTGVSPDIKPLPLKELIKLFIGIYNQFKKNGYFDEAFGFHCTGNAQTPRSEKIAGKIEDVDLEIFLTIRKKDLFPVSSHAQNYSEDDLFDVIEFLYQHVSKPIDGFFHKWHQCGQHWDTFEQESGRREYKKSINQILIHYENRFELSENGEILHKPEEGFEPIFKADIPSSDTNVVDRISSAILTFRRHGSSVNDRRQAVRDLADVLEYLRPKVKEFLTKKDDKDLFNIANNFGIRHHNDNQKTSYDAVIWLSWMFYFYLSTIHVILRKMKHDKLE